MVAEWGGNNTGGRRTEIVVELLELVEGAEDDDGACHGAHAHCRGQGDLLARVEEQVADDEEGEEGEEDVDDAAIGWDAC